MYKRSSTAMIAILAVIGLSFVPQPVGAADPQVAGWPLAKGAYWVYQGDVTWFNTDAQQEVTDTITWKIEVTEAVQRDQNIGYAVLGSLDDLASYEAGTTPANSVIIQVGGDKYYTSNSDALARLRDQENADDVLVGLIMPELQILDLPLFKGKVFGDPQQITRPDHMYAWWVTDEKPADLTGIEGAPSGMTASQYTLKLTTTGDNTALEFVPGLGIVQYTYVHNGTPASASVKLVEYHPGQ